MKPSSTPHQLHLFGRRAVNGGRSGYHQIRHDRGRIVAERPYLANLESDGRNCTASHGDRHFSGLRSFDNLNQGDSFEGSQIVTRGGYGYRAAIPA